MFSTNSKTSVSTETPKKASSKICKVHLPKKRKRDEEVAIEDEFVAKKRKMGKGIVTGKQRF